MAAQTQHFNSSKGDFASTIRHTLNMMSGKDVANYTLLFMDSTEKHPAGSHDTIFNPSIILGRGGNCQIKYDDRYKTVSREHACIAAGNGGHIVFHNPSAKNPTLVNGTPVNDSQPLKNGDEIKLSNDGPRLRYNTSAVKASTMGFTSRMGVALSQATKPYKRAILGMFIALIVALGFTGYSVYNSMNVSNESNKLAKQISTQKLESQALESKINSLSSSGDESTAEMAKLKNKLNQSEDNLDVLKKQIESSNTGLSGTGSSSLPPVIAGNGGTAQKWSQVEAPQILIICPTRIFTTYMLKKLNIRLMANYE